MTTPHAFLPATAQSAKGGGRDRRQRIVVIIGTRPEAIKMAPVVRRLREASNVFECVVVATAQHRDLLDQVLQIFDVVPDHDLNIMQPDQTLAGLTSRLIAALDALFRQLDPDAVLVQGDTTSVMAAALAACYLNIPVGHVEAGLRTGDLRNPFPEELNRVLTARMARWHFAPTATARDRLLAEGINSADVYLTGNTVIDALLEAREMIAASDGKRNDDGDALADNGNSPRNAGVLPELAPGERLMLVTTHRRENFGNPLAQVCQAILTLLEANPGLRVLFPVHPNPHVGATVRGALAKHPRITLCAPLQYLDFIAAMELSHLILSDSGGVQEEAPALGKPVLVLRDETERPEAVAHGVVELVGTDAPHIVARAQRLLDDDAAWRAMARGSSPYGDGYAAERIEQILRQALCGEPIKLRPLSLAAGPSRP